MICAFYRYSEKAIAFGYLLRGTKLWLLEKYLNYNQFKAQLEEFKLASLVNNFTRKIGLNIRVNQFLILPN